MRWKSARWFLVLMAVVSLALPWSAIADVNDPATSGTDSSRAWEKALDYAACAVSIAAIETGVGIAVAVVSCGKALNLWFDE